ncbi:MAG: hypothetical protein AAGJ54_08190 [Planctomycetota bacterium]
MGSARNAVLVFASILAALGGCAAPASRRAASGAPVTPQPAAFDHTRRNTYTIELQEPGGPVRREAPLGGVGGLRRYEIVQPDGSLRRVTPLGGHP